MTILNIETSTTCCSASITIDGLSVSSVENLTKANHATELPVFIEQLLQQAKVSNWRLDAVALSQGPGSYTGLRIGTSMAKGICYSLNIPLIPIDTLQILCASIAESEYTITEETLLCPMIDARRMEVYTALYQPVIKSSSNSIFFFPKSEVIAKLIYNNAFSEILELHNVYFFGDGANKCRSIINAKNACFIDDIIPRASYMGKLAELQINMLNDKQIAYYEPFYLKEFIAAPSHVKGLE